MGLKVDAQRTDRKVNNAMNSDEEVQFARGHDDDGDLSMIDDLLSPSNQISWDLLDLVHSKVNIDYEKIYGGLLHTPKPIGRSSFRFKRSGIEGSISGYREEVKLAELDDANSNNSLSLNRKFSSKADATKGKTNFLPFKPGGLVDQRVNVDETQFLHRNEEGLFLIPPGFTRGLDLGHERASKNEINELNNIGELQAEDEIDDVSFREDTDQRTLTTNQQESKTPFVSDDVDNIDIEDYGTLQRSLDAEAIYKRNWAYVVDLDHKIENFDELVPNMARVWPFTLDTFQQEAIYHLEQGDSVFVAAHTSAGKTVVAEYAIAMATRNMTKAIYTSPIKALSNQKFRDFKETFKDIDVGLITGDVQINPNANCLIMTTEILRSMLYRGADLIRDVEFVIFDEVHYVNDIDRGVVWEEVIIMLPDHIKYVLLSATVPNTMEFANWIGRTKQKNIYVISTPKRPVPLEIYIWAKNNIYRVIDANGKYSEVEFRKHKDVYENSSKKLPPNVRMGPGSRGGPGGTARGGNRGGGAVANRGRGNFRGRDGPSKNTWISLVHYLKQHNLLPAVVFVFSKKRCEEYADTLNNVDYCTAKEKSEIHMFMDRAVARLKKEDRELPQIIKIRELLSRGIAVHHGGLLPIVKECIEILFARSLVKTLFATETFAMGLNLPTRTVVFDSYRKNDGRGFRNLLPGEFTQMSGRAGRRGLDTTGTVILMSYNEPLSPTDFKAVTLGTPTKLLSQFRLTYNMILNLLRIEALRVEEMIKHSFSENTTQTLLPEHQKTVEMLSSKLLTTSIDECSICKLENAEEAQELLSNYQSLYTQIVEEIQKQPLSRNAIMKTGRLLIFRDTKASLRLGFLVRFDIQTAQFLILTCDLGDDFEKDTVESGMPWVPDTSYLDKFMKTMTFAGSLRIEKAAVSDIQFVGGYRLKASIKNILQNDQQAVQETILAIHTLMKYQHKLKEAEFYQSILLSLHELLEKRNSVLGKLSDPNLLFCPNFKLHYKQLHEQAEIKEEISSLQRLISDENLELLPDYNQRLSVLHTLGYIDNYQRVTLKGRVACEINSGWELVITELILDNFLGDFEPEEIVALLSCFVYEGRTNEEEDPCITPRLDRGRKKILEIVEKLMKVYTEKQILLTSEEQEFLERKRFALINVVYEWARGLSFNEIMQISIEAEGTIVRVITRLDEICREVKNAALIIGDSALHSKMTEAQEKIKRDIVFCASLYL